MVYHILNGDALREQLGNSISGEVIVARECLVDGNVGGKDLSELYEVRARFISENYKGIEVKDYYDKSVVEFTKIQKIPEGAELNLWFEEDLFCQVNLWFVLYLIHSSNKHKNVFLIRPKVNCEFNFGGMDKEELLIAFKNKTKIELLELEQLVQLWKLYQQNNYDEMIHVAEQLYDRFPFVLRAVKAHIDRQPKEGNPGRPIKVLTQIIEDLNTLDFGTIFKEFTKREGIYGFGDLQVKRLLETINSNPNG